MRSDQFIKDTLEALPVGYSLHLSFLYGEMDVQVQDEDGKTVFDNDEPWGGTDAEYLQRAINTACEHAGHPNFYTSDPIHGAP